MMKLRIVLHVYSFKGEIQLNDYTFAVAKIRELENSLLTADDLERFTQTHDTNELLSLFHSKGIDLNSLERADEFFDYEKEKVWQTVNSFSENCSEIQSLTVINDFYNFKTAIKSLMKKTSPDEYYISPTAVTLPVLSEIIADKVYADLPKYLGSVTQESMDVLLKTHNFQIFDAFLDRCALDALFAFALSSESEMYKKYVEFYITAVNIKIAYRFAKFSKSEDFLRQSLCTTYFFDTDELAKQALGGADGIIKFCEEVGLNDVAETLKISPEKFELYVDDTLTEITKSALTESFTFEPLFAFYKAKENDIKNLKIILTCKKNRISDTYIKERLRKPYV